MFQLGYLAMSRVLNKSRSLPLRMYYNYCQCALQVAGTGVHKSAQAHPCIH